MTAGGSGQPRLSVIVPTLDEAARIEATVRAALQPDVEVVVVDGGSRDATAAEAVRAGARVVESAPGRGVQMNTGARVAQADRLVFLHADTLLPESYVSAVTQTLDRSEVAVGAFRLGAERGPRGLPFVVRCANLRSRWFGLPYGDQALFVRREVFDRLGGYRAYPVMEDFDFVRRARRLGTVSLCAAEVRTSARRWERIGVARSVVINQARVLAYLSGRRPEWIAEHLP